MTRNYFEDHLNDIYTSVQDGNVENFYALEGYLSDRGFRDGFYGIDTDGGLDSEYVDETEVRLCWCC